MAPSQAAFWAHIPASSYHIEKRLPKWNSGEICRKEKQSPSQVPSCQLCTLLISLMGNFSLAIRRKMLTSHHLTRGSE